MLRCLLVAMGCAVSAGTEAASPMPRGGRIIFSGMAAADSLPEGAVRSFGGDGQGFVWIATDGGIARYDGFEFRSVTPATWSGDKASWEYALGAMEVPGLPGPGEPENGLTGGIWVGTRGRGLARYDPKLDQATGWGPGHFGDPSIHCLLTGEDGLWIGTGSGLAFREAGTGEVVPVALPSRTRMEGIVCLVRDSRGHVWAAEGGGAMFLRREDGTWKAAGSCPGVSAMAAGPSGEMVVAGREEIRLLEGDSGETTSVLASGSADRSPLADGEVLSLRIDSRGTVWAGTRSGLWRYCGEDGGWERAVHRAGDPTSLARGAVTALFEDVRRSVLWIGTAEGEICRHDLAGQWFSFHEAVIGGVPGHPVHGVAAARDGGVWLATNQGVARFRPDGERSTVVDGPVLGEMVRVVHEDRRGRLWVGGDGGGLWCFEEGGRGQAIRFHQGAGGRHELPGDEVTCLCEDAGGGIWIGVAGRGLYRQTDADSAFGQVTLGTGAEPVVRFINALAAGADGEVWIASLAGGLWRMGPGDSTATHYREVPGFDFELPSENVTALHLTRSGILWAASVGGGVYRIDPGAGALKVFDRQNRKLPHWVVYGLAEDAGGHVWLSTGAGLVRVDAATGQTRPFGARHGLQETDFSPGAVCLDASGLVYFGGNRGFHVVDPAALPKPVPAPVAFLTGLEVYGETVLPTWNGILKKPIGLTEDIELPHDRRMRFSILFGSLDDRAGGGVSFRFRLDGLEKDWVLADKARKALYTGLAPGTYRFEVQASPDGESWSGSFANLRVRVVPPWHHTWWARLIYIAFGVVVVGGAGAAAHRERLRQEWSQRQQLENARIKAEAALSRQLQHAMFLERTTSAFQRSLDGALVFGSALDQLAGHFQVSRCLIVSQLADRHPPDLLVARHAAPGYSDLAVDPEWFEHPVYRQALATDGALRHHAAGSGAAPFFGNDARSSLVVRLTHMDEVNGVLILQQCERHRTWEEDERKLVDSVAAQFGMAMAQFHLAQREAEQRRELEEARKAADEANRAKSEFLAKMTHELRTPLNAIIGFSEILALDEGTDSRFREHLDIINQSGEHLLGVISDVLEVSKIEAGKAEVVAEGFELEKLLRSVHGMFSVAAEAKGIGLRFHKTSVLPEWVEVDKGKLRQILINLLGNAIKFTDEGGVALRAGVEWGPAVPGHPGRRSAILRLEVSDSGAGIAESEVDRLFQKFVQTRTGRTSQQGTGLGLAIVKGFTELLGGNVEVVSRPGYGSLFAVEIPCVAVAAAPRVERPVAPRGHVVGLAPGTTRKRILVAEDQPVNRLLVQRLLTKVGFELREVENGELAIQAFREFRPDLILMDEDMPLLRGTEATRIILEEAHRLGIPEPVIISLTAFSLEEQRRAAREAGCHGFLSKPFKRDDLFALIGGHLGIAYRYSLEAEEAPAAAA